MPFSPNELIIWTYVWTEDRVHPDESFRENRIIQFIKIENVRKVFDLELDNVWKYYFLHSDNNEANFSLKKYNIWDKIIAIANYNNWNLEDYFAVYEIGKLVKINGNLEIIDSEWTKKDWWKSLWWCGNHKPNNVMNKRDLLKKLDYLNLNNIESIKNEKFLNIFYIFWIILFSILLIFSIILKKRKTKNKA